MRIEIESEVYKWLCIMSVIKASPKQKQKYNCRYELDEQLSDRFRNGIIMKDILWKVY